MLETLIKKCVVSRKSDLQKRVPIKLPSSSLAKNCDFRLKERNGMKPAKDYILC